MKHVRTDNVTGDFSVILESRDTQAAIMTLQPGEVSGEFGNEHALAEQWLYVIAGRGSVRYGKRNHELHQGSLILITRGEIHQIINTAKRGSLRTLNFYVPPAYTKSGKVNSSMKP